MADSYVHGLRKSIITTFDANGGVVAKNPFPGSGLPMRARYLATVTTREKVEWPAGANITELVVCCWASSGTPVAPDEDDLGMLAVDASSDASASAMLTATDSATADAQWYPIPISNPTAGGLIFIRIPLTAPLSQGSLGGGRVDVKSFDGTYSLAFWIGAN